MIVSPAQMLSDDDKRYVAAAQGWFELGLPVEAERELASVAPENGADPAVLCIRWQVCYHQKRWHESLKIGNMLLAVSPESSVPFNFASISLHKLGRTQQAWELALPALERFPEDWQLPYNLACYAAQLGHRDKAISLLRKAANRSDRSTVNDHALEDPDLKPLWRDIKAGLV